MSYETTIAGASARAAEHEWKAHRAHCVTCTAAAGGRQWDKLCHTGGQLRAVKREADQELAEGRRLDKLPIPGQQAFP